MATSRFARSRRSRRCSRIHDAARAEPHEPATARNLHPAGGRTCRRPARRGCRNSRICRCRRRTKSGRPAASAEEEHPQKTRMSLLQRLANVGLGRRDEETEPPIAARASGPAMARCRRCRSASRSARVAQQIAANEPVSEYARRPAPQGLDIHGRPAPVAAAPQGDDHLGYPRLPAAAGQLRLLQSWRRKRPRLLAAGAFFFGREQRVRIVVQATDFK